MKERYYEIKIRYNTDGQAKFIDDTIKATIAGMNLFYQGSHWHKKCSAEIQQIVPAISLEEQKEMKEKLIKTLI